MPPQMRGEAGVRHYGACSSLDGSPCSISSRFCLPLFVDQITQAVADEPGKEQRLQRISGDVAGQIFTCSCSFAIEYIGLGGRTKVGGTRLLASTGTRAFGLPGCASVPYAAGRHATPGGDAAGADETIDFP